MKSKRSSQNYNWFDLLSRDENMDQHTQINKYNMHINIMNDKKDSKNSTSLCKKCPRQISYRRSCFNIIKVIQMG